MRKIRIVFVALAIGLWAAMAVLVHGALQSVESEREVRQETLAERVFDEMERQLGDLSARETARSFAEYRFYLGGAEGAPRSPLSRPPTERYLVGYFQIDPDGVVSSPRIPRFPEQAIERGDWPLADDPQAGFEKLQRLARAGIRSTQQWVDRAVAQSALAESEQKIESRGEFREERSAAKAPAPGAAALGKSAAHDDGSRVAMDRAAEPAPLAQGAPALEAPLPEKLLPEKPAPRQEVDSYQSAVRSLNRAADRKQQLKRKEYVPQAAAPSVAPSEAESAPARPAPQAFARRAARPMDRSDQRSEASGLHDSIDHDVSIARPRPEAFQRAVGGRAQQIVEVDSIVGRWVDEEAGSGAAKGYLVLYRTATLAGRLYRQGLVVDVGRLAEWLRDEVLRGKPLEGARLELGSASQALPSSPYRADRSYRHRFADPFDVISATLSLPVLADAGGAGYLYSISGLLMLVGTLGLFALYRMVSVTVTFAERRSNFVAAVSHELKTPLTSIRMYAEMLRDDMVPTEGKRHEYYATITAESERLTRLINNVLEFSRIEQGTREVNLVVGPIGPVVEEAAALLAPHAQQQGFTIEVGIEPELPAVRFDRDALLQVVFNLVDNALKYARHATDRVIRLDLRRSGDSVVLSVRDRGPGVPSDHLPKIFEPFYRGQEERTRTEKGTGIGLALVRGLCERMGAVVVGRNPSEGGFEVLLTFRLDRDAAVR